jgi:polyhydroxyalkanoate synthesis regulator phasin
MVKRYDEAKKDMEKKIRDGVAEYMTKADIASKKELEALKKEVEELKKACGK